MATCYLLRLAFIAGILFGDEHGSAGFADYGRNRQTQKGLSPHSGETSFPDVDPELVGRLDNRHRDEDL